MKKVLTLLLLGITMLSVTSCLAPRDVVYLQDLTPETPVHVPETQYLRIKPKDKLRINVHCRDEAIASLFNVGSRGGGYGGGTYNSSYGTGSLDLYSYNVDEDGNIDFPVVGKIQVKGLTRQEAASRIREILIEQNLVKDPYINCSFATAYFYTLGELGGRSQVTIPKDAFTIVEAISQAGDIPITGEKTNIQVIREVDGELHTYTVDFTSAASIISSPVYYIQPGDIIYVQPTKKKQYDSTVLGNSVRTPGFWMSTISTFITFMLTIITLDKRF